MTNEELEAYTKWIERITPRIDAWAKRCARGLDFNKQFITPERLPFYQTGRYDDGK